MDWENDGTEHLLVIYQPKSKLQVKEQGGKLYLTLHIQTIQQKLSIEGRPYPIEIITNKESLIISYEHP